MANSKFQARHYEAIASSIHRTRMASNIGKKKHTPESVLGLLVSDLSANFRQDNPNFDLERFKEACGL